jgi:uncharacterized protein
LKTYLLDVNVLLALAWPAHKFHFDAQAWFMRHSKHRWATCPLTQSAFVRISSNPAFSRDAVTAQDALRTLDANIQHPAHVFWPDTIELGKAVASLELASLTHRQITDAYLLGLAVHHQGQLATFDTKIRSLLPPNSAARNVLVEIPFAAT